MRIWYHLADDAPSRLVEADDFASVVTIGIFDGVHRGHQQILQTVVQTAKKQNLQAVALTFDPHPSYVHRREDPVKLIQPLTDRLDTMAALGLDLVWVVPYLSELAQLTPRQFVQEYFVEVLQAKTVVVGHDTRFGINNSGNIETLRKLGEEYGFNVIEVSDILDRTQQRYSSTAIRALLKQGEVKAAAKMLGRNYRLRGVVEKGKQLGRKLGFPTANLGQIEGLMVPGQGVYAGLLVRKVPGTSAVEHLPAAISVGTNPQFGGQKVTVEAHVLGRSDLNLYGENVAIDFRQWLRPMLQLDSVDELLEQMDDDLRKCAQILGVPPAGRIDPDAVKAQ